MRKLLRVFDGVEMEGLLILIGIIILVPGVVGWSIWSYFDRAVYSEVAHQIMICLGGFVYGMSGFMILVMLGKALEAAKEYIPIWFARFLDRRRVMVLYAERDILVASIKSRATTDPTPLYRQFAIHGTPVAKRLELDLVPASAQNDVARLEDVETRLVALGVKD